MAFKITARPSNRAFTAEADESILQAAQRNGLHLPYGCKAGNCGACKGKILAGEVDYGKYEIWVLPSFEKAQGKALFCQAKPLSDIEIECHEIGAVNDIEVKTLRCRVEKIGRPAPDVAVLSLKLPINEHLQFLAGQYIDILLADGKRRSFSLANPPREDALLELHIRHYGGNFSTFVFEQLKEKALLRFEGPLGTFFLREDSDKPIIFLAGGTGFAPIKGMIQHALHEGSTRPMTLYWGVRAKVDLYMGELAREWQRADQNFRFIPVLSDPAPGDDWSGRTGFVHQAVLDDFADLSGYEVYACGGPAMVGVAHESFIKTRALPEDEFYSDPFTISADARATGGSG
jgi:CDP-4-dehydro-6-deoxyglucose reductase, E3